MGRGRDPGRGLPWEGRRPTYVAPRAVEPFTPATIEDLYAWFKAHEDNVTLDGSSNVQVWADLTANALDLSQATSTARPAFDSENATLGTPAIDPDGGDRLRGAVAADWNLLHDGTGVTICFVIDKVVETVKAFCDTSGASANGHGVFFYYNGATANFEVWRGAGSGSSCFVRTGLALTDGKQVVIVRHATTPPGGEAQYNIRISGAEYTGSYANAASATDASVAMAVLGSSAGLDSQSPMGEIAVYQRYLTDAEIALLETYFG